MKRTFPLIFRADHVSNQAIRLLITYYLSIVTSTVFKALQSKPKKDWPQFFYSRKSETP